jgi:fatty acid desaturase
MAQLAQDFDIRHARRLLKDEFVRRPAIYWADMLVTTAVGYCCAAVYLTAPWSLLKVACFIVAGLALFRVGSFIHEIAHMGKGVMTSFKVAWNICCGIPMLMPSYLYDCHIDHHAIPHYGTKHDGEYLPLGRGPLLRILWYLGEVLLIPLLAVIRFLVLTPVSFCHPKLRTFVLERCSSYVMNPWYRRELPVKEQRWVWALLDWACFVRVVPMVAVVLIGAEPWTHWLNLYLLAVYVIGLNWTRNLVAHTYRNEGQPMSHQEQLADSINIRGVPVLTELLFPLGLRYHALHHLFAGLPYHSLGRAHRKLLARLPEGSVYHQTVRAGFLSALVELWRNATGKGRAPWGEGGRVEAAR